LYLSSAIVYKEIMSSDSGLIWNGAHELNKESVFWEKGAFSRHLLSTIIGGRSQGQTWEEYYEESYGGEQWWIHMKDRIENKDERQIALDRKLVETVGNSRMDGGKTINVQKVQELIQNGAKPDFWVSLAESEEKAGGGRGNAIEMAVRDTSAYGKDATRILVEAFPEYRQTDTKEGGSLLGDAFELNTNWEVLVETKINKNPLYAFLRWSDKYSKKEKFDQLEKIANNYTIGTEIKKAVSTVLEFEEMGDERVVENLLVLNDYCKKKGIDLGSCLGQPYGITDKICFRFKFHRKPVWVAQFLKDRGMTGMVKVREGVIGNKSTVFLNGKDIRLDENGTICPKCDTQQECICGNFIKFVQKTGNFNVDLKLLFGIGGEALVYKRKDGNGKTKAFKIIPVSEITLETQKMILDSQKQFAARKKTRFVEDEIHDLAKSGQVTMEKAKESPEFDFSNINHPNLMKYENIIVDVINGEFCFVVVMPIYDINLWQFFKKQSEKKKKVSMSDRFKLFWSIFAGLEEIHRNGMKHLDIKLSNVMMKVGWAGKFDGQSCVISDFGIGGKKHKKTGLAGTPGFASPEQLISDQVGTESDLYSLGRLMVFIFSEWKTAWTILYNPVEAISTVQMKTDDQTILQIIPKLLMRDPEMRISLDDLKNEMKQAETYLRLKPIELDPTLLIDSNVSENTQCSVYMQKDIETRTQQMKIGNRRNFLIKSYCNLKKLLY